MAHNTPHTTKSKKKMSDALKEKWKDPEFKSKMNPFKRGCIPWNKGLKCPYTTERNLIDNPSKKGEKHWNWKGGITSLMRQIRNCFKYRQWRSDVFTRDDFTCQNCGDKTSGNLNAHHIKPFAQIIKENKIKTVEQALNCEELWNINNGLTLCKKCHSKIHNYKSRNKRV